MQPFDSQGLFVRDFETNVERFHDWLGVDACMA